MLDSISFIGGGVMAEAMIQGLLAKGLVLADHVTASDPRKKRQEELHHLCGIRVTGDNVLAAKAGEIVVFAVKPQVLGNVLQELKGALERRQRIFGREAASTAMALQVQRRRRRRGKRQGEDKPARHESMRLPLAGSNQCTFCGA